MACVDDSCNGRATQRQEYFGTSSFEERKGQKSIRGKDCSYSQRSELSAPLLSRLIRVVDGVFLFRVVIQVNVMFVRKKEGLRRKESEEERLHNYIEKLKFKTNVNFFDWWTVARESLF